MLLVFFALGNTVVADQDHYILDPAAAGVRLQSTIRSPADFLGFKIGDRAIRHNETVLYFRYLAENSDRAEFARYGRSPAGRELIRLVISDPVNLQNLSEIKRSLNRIGGAEPDNSTLIESIPAVAWMGYGIHGDELASTDAAVMLAYRLIAGEDDEIRAIRQNLVIYVDPMYNPDGRARATGHVDTFKRLMPSNDPQDIVHNQLWPDGRGNHYLFDLNRDALFQIQTQSQQRVNAIRDANPQLYVASHETEWSDTYLFAVPAEPMNPFLPRQVHESWADFSRDQSAALDQRGISYYTRAWNEVFYPGYYDVWPAYMGAVPILYEQAATAGLSIRVPSEKIRTFREAVSNHYRSSMANLMTASRIKNTLLNRWTQARQDARRNRSTMKTWIVLPDNKYKTRESLRILRSLGIEVGVLTNPTSANGLRSYWDVSQHEMQLPRGTLRVDVDQSLGGLVHNLFDYHIPMTAEFMAREKRNLDLGHDTQLYDITAWSLPLAFNAAVYWSDSAIRGDWQPAADDSAPDAGREILGSPANYGYIYTDDSLLATARMLDAGVKIRVGNEPFVHQSVSFPAGTFLVRGEEQSVDVLPLLNLEYKTGEIDLVAAQSARIVDGGPDLGGDDFSLLEQPRIAVLGGTGVVVTNFGAIWHLFDEKARIPIALLDIENLNDFDLSEYSVLILPEVDEEDERLFAIIQSGALQRWLESDGTLITMGRSSLLLTKSGLTSIKGRDEVLETHPPMMLGRSAKELISNDFLGLLQAETLPQNVLRPVINETVRPFVSGQIQAFDVEENIVTFADWSDELELPDDVKMNLVSGLKKYLPHGAYLRVDLKPGHWLSYGVGDRIPALFRDKDVLIAGSDAELVGRYSGPGDLMMSGLVWPEAVGYISGTAYLVREEKERGQIIAFANDPVFRGYSHGTTRLFLNAVVLGSAYK